MRTFNEKGRCSFSCEVCWGTGGVPAMLDGVSPVDPELTGVGGPCSTGLSPPDVDEEGDLTLPCNQPNQRALLGTQSPPPRSPYTHGRDRLRGQGVFFLTVIRKIHVSHHSLKH